MEQQEDNINTNQNFEQTPNQQRALNTISPPASRASSALRQGTANTGLPRRRIKWTHDMNVSVLKAYYMATRDNSLVGYRQQMYNIFLAEHPGLGHLTQQNLADRRAAIIRNNLIPTTLREEIRLSILSERNQETSQRNGNSGYDQDNNQSNNETFTHPGMAETVAQEDSNTIQVAAEPQATENSQSHVETQGDDLTSVIKFIYNAAKIKFMEMNPQNRPYLPKQKSSRELYRITSIVNTEIIPTEIPRNPSYDQIISTIYCSAYTITQAINHLRKKYRNHNNQQETTTTVTNNSRNRDRTTSSRPEKPRWQARLQAKIEEIRQDLGYITSHISNKTGKRSRNKLNKIKRRYLIHTQFDPPNRTIEQIRDTIKQKLAKYTTRLRHEELQ